MRRLQKIGEKVLFLNGEKKMAEQYYGGGQRSKHYSVSQIRKMKENMKKVPKIQKKAEQYQKKEEQEAEKLLQQLEN